MKALHLATAIGSMQILLDESVVNTAKKLGCTPKEWELLVQPKSWSGTDRVVIKQLLDNLLTGMLSAMGLPAFEIPAEMAATAIAIYVSPCNSYAASSWVGNYHRADELGNFDGSFLATQGLEKVTASQLFSLTLQIRSGQDLPLLAKRFREKTGIQLGCLEVLENEKEIR